MTSRIGILLLLWAPLVASCQNGDTAPNEALENTDPARETDPSSSDSDQNSDTDFHTDDDPPIDTESESAGDSETEKDDCPDDPNKTQPGACGCGVPEEACSGGAWQSSVVYYENGGLKYVADAEGNRIPDFSYVGYKYGEDLPHVPVVHSISPIEGDNTAHIQAAVDHVGSLPQDGDGFRGALLLGPGIYSTNNIVRVPYDGVVIRGSGAGTDPAVDTVISSTRSGTDACVVLLGNPDSNTGWNGAVSGTTTTVTDSVVPIGEKTFNVEDASRFEVGDMVAVLQTPSSAWFSAVDQGGTAGDTPWGELDSSFAIHYLRFVGAVQKSALTVDAPLYHRMENKYGDIQIYKYDTSVKGRKIYRRLGIENLRIDIQTNGGTDEDHTETAVRFQGVIDGWARDVTALHFKKAGFSVQRSSRITVESCLAGPPVSQITGGRRYNFDVDAGGQQVLFKDCVATDARHGFVANGATSSNGIVVVGGELQNNFTGSEGHRHWSLGMLFDSSSLTSHGAGDHRGYCAYNRGDWGTSHGWGSANSVLWNIASVEGTSNVVQKPPTAQNWAIGVDHATGKGPFDQPAGFIEGTFEGSTLFPPSLYRAQLAERRAR